MSETLIIARCLLDLNNNFDIFSRIGGDLLPSDESDEEYNDSITSRNPKGKLKFLLGPMDPRSRRRYIHAGRFFVCAFVAANTSQS